MRTGPRSVSAIVVRGLPVVVVPLAVAIFQPNSVQAELPIVLLGLVCGALITLALPRPLLAFPAVLLVVGLLLSMVHVHELQLADAWEHAPAEAARFSVVPAARRSGHVAEVINPKLRGATSDISASGLAPATMETISVVLPCAFEGLYAAKTVEAIWGRSRQDRIKEIVVVVDGSTPPLETQMPKELLSNTPGAAPMRLLRHEKTLGLIAAKRSGGDAATGDVIVFFDCHVSSEGQAIHRGGTPNEPPSMNLGGTNS